jgi:uncharacterized membrane protein YfcA
MGKKMNLIKKIFGILSIIVALRMIFSLQEGVVD